MTMEPLYGDRSLLSLLVVLNRTYQVLNSHGLTVENALELLSDSKNIGARSLLITAKKALSGNIVDALKILETPDEASLILDAASRLEEILAEASSQYTKWLASLAEWSAARLYYLDGTLFYLDAISTRLQFILGRKLDRVSSLKLITEIQPAQEHLTVKKILSLFDTELCFPRRYCPAMVPPSTEDSRNMFLTARGLWEELESTKIVSKESLPDRLLVKIEKPFIETIFKKLIGDIPGVTVVLKQEDLDNINASVIIYDNTIKPLNHSIKRVPALHIPIFEWAGDSLESKWINNYRNRLWSAILNEISAAPIYSFISGVHRLSRIIPDAQPRVYTKDDDVILELPYYKINKVLSINIIRNVMRSIEAYNIYEGWNPEKSREIILSLVVLKHIL